MSSSSVDIDNAKTLSSHFQFTDNGGKYGGFKKFIFFTKRIATMAPVIAKITSDEIKDDYSSIGTSLSKVGSKMDSSLSSAKRSISNASKSSSASSFFSGRPSTYGMWGGLETAAYYMGKIFLYPKYLISVLNKKLQGEYSNLSVSWLKVNTSEERGSNSGSREMGAGSPDTSSVSSFLNSAAGTSAVEFGPASGTQCVELPNYYANYVLGAKQQGGNGNGNEYAQTIANRFPSVFTYHNANETPQAGDIISLVGTQTQYGHAAVVKDVSNGQLTLLEQWAGSGDIKESTYSIPGSGKRKLLGIARPNNLEGVNLNEDSSSSSDSSSDSSSSSGGRRMANFISQLSESTSNISKTYLKEMFGVEDLSQFLTSAGDVFLNIADPEVASAVKSAITSGSDGNGDYIGDYVKHFESGSAGSSMISKGTGDYGGVSFGTYQFPTYGKSTADSSSMLSQFWNTYYKSKYGGTPGNNQDFKNKWLQAVNDDPEGFRKNEHAFIKAHYYDPQVNRLSGILNPNTHSRAAQEMTWSTAVQFGSATNVIKNALGNKNSQNLSAADLVNKVSDYKTNNNASLFSSSSADVRASVKNRHNVTERNILLGLGDKGPIGGSAEMGSNSGGSVHFQKFSGFGPSALANSTPTVKMNDYRTEISDDINKTLSAIKVANESGGNVTTAYIDTIIAYLKAIEENTRNTSSNTEASNKNENSIISALEEILNLKSSGDANVVVVGGDNSSSNNQLHTKEVANIFANHGIQDENEAQKVNDKLRKIADLIAKGK